MRPPNLIGLVFLTYVCALVPWAAMHSRARVSAIQSGAIDAQLPSRRALYASACIQLTLLAGLALLAGQAWHFAPFVSEPIGAAHWIAGAAVLAFSIGVMTITRWSRTDDERRALFTYHFAPRNAGDIAFFTIVAVTAGIGEEIAYRGAAFQLLDRAWGTPWPAYAIAIAVFTVGHAVQGRKSVIAIGVLAIAMHALVWYTGTLIVAMAVHAVYDVIAGLEARREARALEAQTTA